MRACLRCRIRNKINESCWGGFFFHQNIFWCKKAGQRAVKTSKRSAASLFPIDAVVWQLKALGALTVSHTNCRFHFVYPVCWAINGTTAVSHLKKINIIIFFAHSVTPGNRVCRELADTTPLEFAPGDHRRSCPWRLIIRPERGKQPSIKLSPPLTKKACHPFRWSLLLLYLTPGTDNWACNHHGNWALER